MPFVAAAAAIARFGPKALKGIQGAFRAIKVAFKQRQTNNAVDALIKGGNVTKNTKRLINVEKTGGMKAANKAFDQLAKTTGKGKVRNIKASDGTPMRVIDLKGGGEASVRGFSTRGKSAPTLQVNRPSQPVVKTRFREGK